MPTKLLVVGAGGHSKVVIEAIQNQYQNYELLLVDQNIDKQGEKLLGNIPIAYLESWSELPENFHIAIGSNVVRSRLAIFGQQQNKKYFTVIHSAANISKSALVGDGCFVAANAVIAAETKINEGCIVNHGAVIDHDCIIGSYSHIAPNATLSGGVHVGEMCVIGTGAILLPMIKIGNQVTIGAGAVVISDVPANETVVGVPAKCIK